MTRRRPKLKEYVARTKLIPGNDDDLIEWWESLPEGEASQMMRDTLRAGLGIAIQGGQPNNAMIELINQRVTAIFNYISSGAALHGNGTPQAGELPDEQAELIAERIRKQAW